MSILMHIVGAFYVFCGVVLLRQMAMDRLMDAVLAALASPVSAAERLQSRLMILGGVLLLAAGLAAATLSMWSAALFAATFAAQGLYLLWAARARAPEDETERKGRRQTIIAFILFTAAFAAVLFAQAQDVFGPWPLLRRAVDGPVAAAVELALLLLAAWAVWLVIARPARLTGADDVASGEAPGFDDGAPGEYLDDLQPPGPRMNPMRLRLAPEYRCWPVWDDETGDNVPPHHLDLSPELRDRLEEWDWQFQCQYDERDPAASGFKDAEHEARWRAEGEAIAAQLRVEWPRELVVRL